MASLRIPFNRAAAAGDEAANIAAAIEAGHLAADGEFTQKCRGWLEQQTGAQAALLVTSCTAALEISALLAGVGPGDEVVMPSFTHVSTANAFAACGATPVFVDIRADTMNIDEALIEDAVTPRTRGLVPVHYAGVGCEMDAIGSIADANGLILIEDAAQGILATYRGRPLGSFGALAAISFHETKNVTCGEGGALLVNDPGLLARAEVLREKGTNRNSFLRGEVSHYAWVDLGSSYAMSELNAAFLWAQLQAAEQLTARRRAIWDRYHAAFESLEREGRARRPVVPPDRRHNAHMYSLLLEDEVQRDRLIAELRARGIGAIFHYVPAP